MTAYRRWQDWVVMVAGAALVLAPRLAGETSDTTALWTTLLVGGAMVVCGLLAASTRFANAMELFPFGAGFVALLAPWVMGYEQLPVAAWASWIAGLAAIIASSRASLESADSGRI